MTTEDREIPVPEDTGSSGEQEPAREGTQIIPKSPQTGMPVVDAIEGLVASRTRSLGEFGSVMLAATARQLADENASLKDENRLQAVDLSRRRDELESERVRNAVLSERIRADRRNKHIRNFAIAVGTALASTGIILSRSGGDMYSTGLIVLGTLLLLVSWFGPTKGAEK